MSVTSTADTEILASASYSPVQSSPTATRMIEAGSEEKVMDLILLELLRVLVEDKSDQSHAEIETLPSGPSSSHLHLLEGCYGSQPQLTENEEQRKGTLCTPEATDDEKKHFGSPPLMQKRLLQTGVCKTTRDFAFVPSDEVSEDHVKAEVKSKFDDNNNGRTKSVRVKTGVWEVISFDKDTGTPNEPFYVVTGVSMDDRIDTRKLRRALFPNRGQEQTKRPKLRLAPTPIGEALTGYKSGTMAPICHSTNMRLFLEESLLPDDQTAWQSCQVLCGSGLFGQCLSISADKFLRITEQNTEGVEIVPLIKERKGPPRSNTRQN